MTGARSVPEVPLWRAVMDMVIGTFTGMGLDPTFAATLPTLFRRAGLGNPRLALGAPVGGADDTDLLAFAVEVVRSLLPVAEELGLVTDDCADPDALLPWLREEVAAAATVVTSPALISAWSQV
jgi:hypothetical protein